MTINHNKEETPIPGDSDWHSEAWGLDEPYAYKNFYGKSLDEARRIFEHDCLGAQEDLSCMPFSVFKFYIWAIVQYLLSEKSKGDADGANGFLLLVKIRKDDIRKIGGELLENIIKVIKRIEHGQEWFDADKDINGDYKVQANAALAMLGMEENQKGSGQDF